MPPAPRRERTELGKALDERRAGLGYQTIEQLASAAGVSPKTVSNLLNGATRFRAHVLLPLNQALRLPPDTLRRALAGDVTPSQIRAMAASATGPVFAETLMVEFAARGVLPPDPGTLMHAAGVLTALADGAPAPDMLRQAAGVLAAVSDMLPTAEQAAGGLQGILAARPHLTAYDAAAITAAVQVPAGASGEPGLAQLSG
jgi:hypothetical protein